MVRCDFFKVVQLSHPQTQEHERMDSVVEELGVGFIFDFSLFYVCECQADEGSNLSSVGD